MRAAQNNNKVGRGHLMLHHKWWAHTGNRTELNRLNTTTSALFCSWNFSLFFLFFWFEFSLFCLPYSLPFFFFFFSIVHHRRRHLPLLFFAFFCLFRLVRELSSLRQLASPLCFSLSLPFSINTSARLEWIYGLCWFSVWFVGLVVRSSSSVQNLEPEEHEHLSPFIHQPLLAVLFWLL